MTRRDSCSGQATVEMAVVFGGVLVPAIFGMLMVGQAMWTWQSVAALTRTGANYAATHCWQDGAGSNVISYMQSHVPPMIDAQQITNGPAQIQVQYWTEDSANHQTLPFDCAESCSNVCRPDAVTVTISGYQFQSLTRAVGLASISMPPFSTTMHIESSGVNPDTGEALP